MKIAVIGAGITGIATAYELVNDGHAVSVFDKAAAAASGDSFATGGLISPSLLNPWTLPAWPSGLSGRGLMGGTRIKLRSIPSLGELRWLRSWARSSRQSDPSAALNNYRKLVELSQARMQAVAAQQHLEFERSEGSLLIVPSEKDYQGLQSGLAQLKSLGVICRELTPDQARIAEPGLGQAVNMHCALHFPADEVGNCRQFAMLLRTAAAEMGAQFHFNTQVVNIQSSHQHALEIAGWDKFPAFDAIVLCPGAAASDWATVAKLRLPGTLVCGYTLSAALREPLHAPRGAVVTLDSGLVFSRQGMRVRVIGGAELGGASRAPSERAYENLFRGLNQYFPGSANLTAGTQSWRGSRVYTPDGFPVVGPTSTPGIWINAGHGANGWALAHGCGRILADAMQGREPAIDILPLRPDRFNT